MRQEATTQGRRQLEFWLDWRLTPDTKFWCAKLHGRWRVRDCIAWQVETDPFMKDSQAKEWRGKGAPHGCCDTRTCALGRMHREMFRP